MSDVFRPTTGRLQTTLFAFLIGSLMAGSAFAVEELEPRPTPAPADPIDQRVKAIREGELDLGRSFSLAVFTRADALWVIAAPAAPEEAWTLAQQAELALGPALIARASGGVALRFDNSRSLAPKVAQEGSAWRVTLSEVPLEAGDAALRIESQPLHQDGARVLIHSGDLTERVAFVDPASGDFLLAVPASSPMVGVGGDQRFVQFRLLPTTQGALIRIEADDLAFTPVAEGMAITGASGLLLYQN